MELCIPHRLLHACSIGKVDLAENAVAVCRNERHLGRVGRVACNQNDALERIVRNLVGAAIGHRLAEADRASDSWRAYVEVYCLQQAIAVSDPEKILRGYNNTIGASSSTACTSRSDKAGNLVHIDVIGCIDDVYGCLCPVGDVPPSPHLIDPEYVDGTDTSGHSYCSDRIDGTV